MTREPILNLTHPNTAHHINFNLFLDTYAREIAWVIEHNKTDAPYHNTEHLLGVAYLIWAGCSKDLVIEPNFNSLVIAGLLHDFCYSRDPDDMVNIVETCRAATEFFQAFPQYDEELVMRIITYTYFSFDGKCNPFTEGNYVIERLETAIREADSLYGTFFFDRIVFIGLYEEIGKRFKQTAEEFVVRNIRFICGTKFTLPGLQNLYDISIDKAVQEHCHFYKP